MQTAECDVCGKKKETDWCSICKANICKDCRYSPKRLEAFLRRKGLLSKFTGKRGSKR